MSATGSTQALVAQAIEHQIHLIRAERVILDADLAMLYGVATKRLNEQVARNLDRFPPDFMFQLSVEESNRLRSQFASSKKGRGGRRFAPRAFTEQRVSMLSSVLHSPRAVAVNIEIMRAFVRLRQLLSTHADLARRLEDLERKYDGQFRVVFQAIKQLMAQPPDPPPKRIGFSPVPATGANGCSPSHRRRIGVSTTR